jgi:predicted deacylase
MSFRVGDFRVERGSTYDGFLEIAPKYDGSSTRFPLSIVNGREEGPVFLVTGGIHGNEPNGSVAVMRLVRSMDPESLRGTLVGVPVVNLEALSAGKRGNETFDHFVWDMNRVFPGRADGYPLERLAHSFVAQVAEKADYHVDLHSGATSQFLADTAIVHESEGEAFELAKSSGASVIAPFPEQGTLGHALRERGIPSFGFEVGAGVMSPTDYQECVARHVELCENVMKELGMHEGRPSFPAERYVLEEAKFSEGTTGFLRVDSGGFAMPEPDLRLLSMVEKHQLVGKVYDLFGNVLEEVRAPYEGLVWGIRVNPVVQPGDLSVCYIGKIVEVLG